MATYAYSANLTPANNTSGQLPVDMFMKLS